MNIKNKKIKDLKRSSTDKAKGKKTQPRAIVQEIEGQDTGNPGKKED